MEFLSWLFFCLSPFALFCSEDGNGLLLCPIFIILGFVFKYLGKKEKTVSYTNSDGKKTTYKIKKDNKGNVRVAVEVSPLEFWRWHYRNRMKTALINEDSVCDELIAYKDKEARRWATTICGYHNAWVPPEVMQEKFAREDGVVTEQMIKERNEKKDRIQIGKCFLMCKLKEKYHATKIGKGGRERCCFPGMTIKEDIYKIKTSDGRPVDDWYMRDKYKKTVREIWETLSEEEKNQSAQWVEEYEKKLIELCNEYVHGNLYRINVQMDF